MKGARKEARRKYSWLRRYYDNEFVDIDGYTRMLEESGFCNVRVYSISDQVFLPFARYVKARKRDRAVRHVNPMVRVFYGSTSIKALARTCDYVVAVGDKKAIG